MKPNRCPVNSTQLQLQSVSGHPPTAKLLCWVLELHVPGKLCSFAARTSCRRAHDRAYICLRIWHFCVDWALASAPVLWLLVRH